MQIISALTDRRKPWSGSSEWASEDISFPSISDYFHIPIIFDYLDIHCPTDVMTVGTIFFPWEQFFFQYGLLQFLLESFQVEVLIRVLLSSTKIEVVKVERLPWPGIEPGSFRSEDGRSTNELMVLLLFAHKNSYSIYLSPPAHHIYTMGQSNQKCK